MRKSRLDIQFPLRNQLAFWFGKTYIPESNEFLLNHSRSALSVALQSLNLSENSKVGMMVYNCHTVMNAIWQCNLAPVFIDVTDGLTIDMDHLSRIAGDLKVLIVTHLFGIKNNVSEIRKKYPNLIIIEDCAHAFGIKQIEGDFATFSIGQGKLPSIGDGGILVVKNKSYVNSVSKQLSKLKVSRSPILFLKLLFKAMLYSPVVYNSITRHILKYRTDKIVNPLKVESIRLMDLGVSAIYQRELKNIPEMILTRLNSAKRIAEVHHLFFGLNAFMACGIFDSPKEKSMEFTDFDSGTHFMHCIDWARYYGYVDGSCPMAEYLTKHLLVVPTYFQHK